MARFNSNMIVLGADGKKEKKGDGVNEILVLMKEVREFQDKLDNCIEAQALTENKVVIEKFYQYVDKMYSDLLEMAKGGIGALRKKPEQAKSEPEVEKIEKPSSTPIVTAPVSPQM